MSQTRAELYEQANNKLIANRVEQNHVLQVIIQETKQTKDEKGNVIPAKLSGDYLVASSKYKELLQQEKALKRELDRYDPELVPEMEEEVYFDDQGEIQFRLPQPKLEAGDTAGNTRQRKS